METLNRITQKAVDECLLNFRKWRSQKFG